MLSATQIFIYCLIFRSLLTPFISGYPITSKKQQNPPEPRILNSFFKSDENDVKKVMTPYTPFQHFQNLPMVHSGVMDNVYPDDSRIIYFRMPVSASPYHYFNELENFMNQNIGQTPYFPYDMVRSSIPIHLPITFTSNGKPSGIYTFSQNDFHAAQSLQSPFPKRTEKPMINLSNGPYTFNGKPADIYLLQDSFNPIMSNSLSSF